MRLWLASLIVFLLTCAVQSHEKHSPKKGIHGRKKSSTPYPTAAQDTSCSCTFEFNPVCGSDGLTYGNPCAFRCAQKDNPELEKAHDGECEPTPTTTTTTTEDPGCFCTLQFDPVCGSDGATYGNACALGCAQRKNPDLKFAHDGECQDQCPPPPKDSEGCVCTEEFNPVCGSDGKTYDNFCFLCCAQRDNPYLVKVHNGTCKRQCPAVPEGSAGCACTREYKPVCGSDGQTYGNFCVFCCEQRKNPYLKWAHDGECERQCPPVPEGSTPESCPCTKEFKPVCGSDWETYGNMCMFCCAQRLNEDLTKVHDGTC